MTIKLVSSSLIKNAVYFAAEQHDGQYRKGVRVPFFAHPVLVAFGVLQYTQDEKTLAAAILHDVLEDCPNVTEKKIEKIFGKEICKIVTEVTFVKGKNDKNKTWKDRKKTNINKIKNASREALLIIASDKICNMKGYFEFAQLNGQKELSKLFNGSLEDHFWYYDEILLILKSKLIRHPIVREYDRILKYYKLTLSFNK